MQDEPIKLSKVDIEAIDSEHVELVALLRAASRAALEGRDGAVVQDRLQAALDFFIRHTANEEAVFADHGYPPHMLQALHDEHQDIIARVGGLIDEMAGCEGDLRQISGLVDDVVWEFVLHANSADVEFKTWLVFERYRRDGGQ